MTALRLAAVFSDHMVMQRGTAVPVWGWAVPGDRIEVAFEPGTGATNARQTRTVQADAHGAWRVTLDPLQACTVPARAWIEGDTVIVWSDTVARPVTARYAWSDCPDGNLYNRDGLPAPPFRTDDWPA